MSVELIRVKRIQEIEVEEILASYSPKAIEQLIANDLINQGFEVDKLCFKTNFKQETDEWGMNPRTVSYFQGADVTVKER